MYTRASAAVASGPCRTVTEDASVSGVFPGSKEAADRVAGRVSMGRWCGDQCQRGQGGEGEALHDETFRSVFPT